MRRTVWFGNLKRRDSDVDGRMLLKVIRTVGFLDLSIGQYFLKH